MARRPFRLLPVVAVAAIAAPLVLGAVSLARRQSPVAALADARRFLLGYGARTARSKLSIDERTFGHLAVTQLGYGPDMVKHFTSARPFNAFRVTDENGTVVFTGHGPLRAVDTSVLGDISRVWIGDFTALRAPGRFTVAADNGLSSYSFIVGEHVFDAAVRAVQRALYFQRAFTAVDAAHAEGPWVHASDASRAPAGVRGGWHDAGDFTIYNAQAASSLFWLLQAYSDFAPASDATNIPESGNGVPDLLDEARWELEWLLSVQDPAGGFRNTTCVDEYGPYGTNSHDTHNGALSPIVYRNGEVGTIPTARAVGTLGFAASVFRPIDRAFADQMLDAARRGWAFLESRAEENSDGPTCPNSRQNGDALVGRHVRMYAAAGMLLATGEEPFETAFEINADSLDNDPSTYRFNIYAALVYLRAAAGDAARKAAIVRRLREQASSLHADAERHPFEWSGRYFWGSVNAGFERAGAFAVRLCLDDPLDNRAHCEDAASNIHYAFGRNIYQLSYVNGIPGVTRAHQRAFHHWLATLNATPFLFPGLVAGGPNTSPEPSDRSAPHSRPLPVWGYWDDPAMPRDERTPIDGRYTDNDSWSTNEVDVVWQAATLYNLYFMQWYARLRASGS